jgi:hypothetical protein
VGRNTSQNIGANLAINFSTTELVWIWKNFILDKYVNFKNIPMRQ